MFGYGVYKKRDIELYKELNASDEIVINRLRMEIMQLEESRDLVQYISTIKDETIIGIVHNNDSVRELFVLTKRENSSNMTITMKNPYRKEFPNVYVSLYKDIKIDEDGEIWISNQEVYIEEIQAINKREGNGRALINAVIAYAKENQYKTIAGRIKDNDKEATPGLPAFYTEMEFTLNEAETYFEMKL